MHGENHSMQAIGITEVSLFAVRLILLGGLFVFVVIRESRNLKEVKARRLKSS